MSTGISTLSSRGWRVLLGFILLFFFTKSALPLSSGRSVKPLYAFEFLTFKRAELGDQTLMEIFCQIPTDNLIFIKYKKGFFASYELAISMQDSLGHEVARQSFIDSVKVKTFKEIDRPRIPKLIRFHFIINPGDYEARIELTDVETRHNLSFKRKISVSDYTKTGLQLSDLQIAISMNVSQKDNVLVKNDREIVPNVSKIVGGQLTTLFLYSEIYNLRYSLQEPNKELVTTYVIKNARGDEVRSLKRTYEKPGETCVVAGSIPVADLASGEYQLFLTVEDLDSGQKNQRSTHFLVIKTYSDLQTFFEQSNKDRRFVETTH
ncbi:MAG: hypothetical protein ACE5IR_05300 [bacterium]